MLKHPVRLLSLFLLVLATGARPAEGDASGCSLIGGYTSPWGCGGGASGCYECFYWGGSSGTHCYETADGSTTYCIDFQGF